MSNQATFPLIGLLRKALWASRAHPEMGAPTLRLSQASSDLNKRIERYQLQSLFSAAFNETFASKTATGKSVEEVSLELRAYLPRLQEALRKQGVTALVTGSAAAFNYYNTFNNGLLLDGRIDLLIAPVCYPAVRRLLISEGFEPQVSDTFSSFLFTRESLTCCLHTASARFFNPATRRRYTALETAYRQSDAQLHQAIGVTSWPGFPPLFLMIHLTARIQQELFDGHPSIRSFCDWMMALHGERTSLGIAEPNLLIRLDELHLYDLYRALGSIAQSYFGLERNSYAGLMRLTESEQERGEWLWRCFVDRRIPKCRPALAYQDGLTFMRKIKCWSQMAHRSGQLRHLCYQEASFAPWAWLVNRELR